MAAASALPAPRPGVFTLEASSHINAPIDAVWDILFDLSVFHEWNPFVRAMHIHDASGQPISRDPIPGDQAVIRTNIPPVLNGTGKNGVTCTIAEFDKTNHRAQWDADKFPRWFLYSIRWSVLSEVLLDDGAKQTRYETREIFSGLGAWLIKWFIGSGLQRGFDEMASTLKRRAEEHVS